MNLCLDPHSTFSTEEKEVLFLLCFLASYNTFCILSFFLLLLFLLSPFLNQIVFSLLCFKSSSYILIIVLYLHVFCKYIFRTPQPPRPCPWLIFFFSWHCLLQGRGFLMMISLNARQCQFSNFFSSSNVLNIPSCLSLHKILEPVK